MRRLGLALQGALLLSAVGRDWQFLFSACKF